KMFHVEHCRDWWLKPVTEAGKFRQGDPKPQRGSPDPSNPSTTPYASPNAASSADGSFPPASARSGRPPPLPPTRWATGPITLPACTREVKSLVTPTISATFPSEADPSTTTPDPILSRS